MDIRREGLFNMELCMTDSFKETRSKQFSDNNEDVIDRINHFGLANKY